MFYVHKVRSLVCVTLWPIALMTSHYYKTIKWHVEADFHVYCIAQTLENLAVHDQSSKALSANNFYPSYFAMQDSQ